jgi:acyl-CoA thioesterase
MTILTFSDVMADQTRERGQIPPGWTQGRATYGGLTAAMLYRSLALQVAEDVPLRWVSISLVAPSEPGEVVMRPRVLRQGRNVIQAECHMSQNGQVVAAMQAAFGRGRESVIHVPPSTRPDFPPPEDSGDFPYIEGVTPEFLQHFQVRLARGQYPYTGAQTSDLGGWMRFAQPTGPSDPTVLLGMLDSWPPTVLQQFKKPAPVSTLTWTVQFLQEDVVQPGDEWWQYLAQTDAGENGYVQASARLWDRQGSLVAISQQTVAVFA